MTKQTKHACIKLTYKHIRQLYFAKTVPKQLNCLYIKQRRKRIFKVVFLYLDLPAFNFTTCKNGY